MYARSVDDTQPGRLQTRENTSSMQWSEVDYGEGKRLQQPAASRLSRSAFPRRALITTTRPAASALFPFFQLTLYYTSLCS